MTFDAIVLCGGSSRRLGGMDKAVLVVGERSLIDRALAAVADASTTIAVGPQREATGEAEGVGPNIVWTIEDPPGGGPVAGIAAGLEIVTADVVVVLGVDFPLVGPEHVARLLRSLEGELAEKGPAERDGSIYVDETGRHQFLVGAYRTDVLRAALRGRVTHGMAVKDLISDLDLVLLADPRATQDVDTWEDVGAADTALES